MPDEVSMTSKMESETCYRSGQHKCCRLLYTRGLPSIGESHFTVPSTRRNLAVLAGAARLPSVSDDELRQLPEQLP